MQYYQMTGFMGITDQPAEAVGDFKLPDPDQSALYLDFDGTLVEIAERPDDIDVTATITGILDRAMERLDGRVALVSGRSIADLQKFIPNWSSSMRIRFADFAGWPTTSPNFARRFWSNTSPPVLCCIIDRLKNAVHLHCGSWKAWRWPPTGSGCNLH